MQKAVEQVPDIRTWRYVKSVQSRKLNNRVVPGLTGVLYVRGRGDTKQSAVVHRYRGRVLFVAWGLASAKHCGAYAVYSGTGWGPAILGCPQVSVQDLQTATPRIRIFDGSAYRTVQ